MNARRLTRRRLLRQTGLVLALGGPLTACGGGSGAAPAAGVQDPGAGGPGQPRPASGTPGERPAGAVASRQSGAWGDAATWEDGRVPRSGETAYVAPGHTVTLTSATTVGADRGAAVTVAMGGTLVVAGDLTLRGHLRYERGAAVRIEPASGELRITLDAPAGATCRIAPLESGGGTPSLVAAGGPDRRITITAGGRGGSGRVDAANLPSALSLSHVTLLGLGSRDDEGLTAETRDDGSPVTLRGVRVRDCGRVLLRCRAEGRLEVDGLDLREPRGSTYAEIDARSDKGSGGSRRLSKITTAASRRRNLNFFVRDADLCRDLVLVDTSLVPNGDRRNVIELAWFLATDREAYIGMAPNAGTTLRDSAIATHADNPHPVREPGRDAGVGSNVVEGCVFDGDGVVGSDAGDCVLPTGDVVMTRTIAFNKAGTIASCITRTGSITVERTTAHDAFGLSVGETHGHPDQCRAFRNNLVVAQDYAVRQRSAMVPQARFEYDGNVTFALTGDGRLSGRGLGPAEHAPWWAGGGGYGTRGRGAGDREADPAFRDPSRTARSFDAANGGPGTLEHLAGEIVKLNGWDAEGREAAFDARYAVGHFLDYIREGFSPTNPAVRGAGAVDI